MKVNYIAYSKNLVNQYTYHHSIGNKAINADYYTLIERIGTNPKASKFKVNDRVRITKNNIIFSKSYTEISLK